jgi:hypothetical protein
MALIKTFSFLTIILLCCSGCPTQEGGSPLYYGEETFNTYLGKVVNHPENIKGPDWPYALKGIRNVYVVAALTGEYSINRTLSNYNIYGTDMGIMFNKGNEVFILFGDTHSEDNSHGNHGWHRSNTIAVTTDYDASNGIKFDRMIVNSAGQAKECVISSHIDGVEITKIPTGGFALDNDLYMCFMSVARWGQSGYWDCNYGGLAKSTDNGQTWSVLPNLQWSTGKFMQLFPLIKDGYIYFYGIGGGRFTSMSLMRVLKENVENKAAYEYLTRFSGGEPVYETGSSAESNPYILLPQPVGEPCVMYNEYLGEYIMTYLHPGTGLVMRSSKKPEGPWSAEHIIATGSDYPSLYGAFMNPVYTEQDGRFIYFNMSIFDPVYQVCVVKAELVK